MLEVRLPPADDVADVAEQLRRREAELARVQRIGQVGGLEVDLTGGCFRNRRSPEYLRLHGLPPDSKHESHDAWVARIHPDDRDRVVTHFKSTVSGSAMEYESEYRIIRASDGVQRWILAKAEIERAADGAPLRLVGAHIDVTDRRRAEDERELLARELAHRIKNVFAVVQGVIMLSARSQPQHLDFARTVAERVSALALATQFVSPGGAVHSQSVDLVGFLRTLLSAYHDPRPDAVTCEGDDVMIGPKAATTFALVVHELATNAVKYGALCSAGSTLHVQVLRGADGIVFRWREMCDRPLAGPPEKAGFGTGLMQKVVAGQFHTVLELTWLPLGLEASLAVGSEDLER